MLENLKSRARALKNEAFAVYLAAKDPRTPWYAKVLIVLVVAHTFSPIDLIPDFIPILGYLDDLIITPAGLALAVRLIPAEVLAEARVRAAGKGVESLRRASSRRRVGLIGAGIIVSLWILTIIWGASIILRLVERP